MVLIAGVSTVAMANGDGDGIIGSPHDFTDDIPSTLPVPESTWNARKEICRVCHVPHDHQRATQYYLNGLLWNHAVSSQTYTMYDSSWSETLTGTQSSQPDGISKLCLGCHDGTVAIDTFDKYSGGSVYIDDYDSGFKIGMPDGSNIDLRGTHPLSIEFPAGEIGTEFNDPSTATWYDGSTVASTLDNGKVQCSTCHDVHDQESVPNTHLLRQAQKDMGGGEQASGLCFTCHIK
jgi:hypothetical protein